MSMSRKFLDRPECLQIKWRERNHYYEFYSEGFFEHECEREVKTSHIFWDNQSGLEEITCIATIRSNVAILAFDESPDDIEMQAGTMTIVFTDSNRKQVERIDWLDETGLNNDAARSNWDLVSDAVEGRRFYREQVLVSRSPELAKSRKIKDNFRCQACGYKLIVEGTPILDCHHIELISEANSKISTLDDVVSLCPNCHRIAHSANQALNLAELRILSKSATYEPE